MVFIVRSASLKSTLTDKAIDKVVDLMRPILKDGLYDDAIMNSLQLIEGYISQKGQMRSVMENFVPAISLGMFTFFLYSYNDNRPNHGRNILEYDGDGILPFNREQTACPLCLKDFAPSTKPTYAVLQSQQSDKLLNDTVLLDKKVINSTQSMVLSEGARQEGNDLYVDGSNFAAVRVPLQCGHSLCASCLLDLFRSDVLELPKTCPICDATLDFPDDDSNDSSDSNIWRPPSPDEDSYWSRLIINELGRRHYHDGDSNFGFTDKERGISSESAALGWRSLSSRILTEQRNLLLRKDAMRSPFQFPSHSSGEDRSFGGSISKVIAEIKKSRSLQRNSASGYGDHSFQSESFNTHWNDNTNDTSPSGRGGSW